MLSDREHAILTMAAILAGRDGGLLGSDLWSFLPAIGVGNVGVMQPSAGFGFSDWIVFLEKENGEIIAQQIYPAMHYDSDMIRQITDFGETYGKKWDGMRETFPTVTEIVAQLKFAQ